MIKKLQNREEDVYELAEKLKLLFMFCADLIPHIDLLKRTYKLAEDREDLSLSMAPILGAHGMNYKDSEIEARIRKERAGAIINLLETLERTESERKDHSELQMKRQNNIGQIRNILGI